MDNIIVARMDEKIFLYIRDKSCDGYISYIKYIGFGLKDDRDSLLYPFDSLSRLRDSNVFTKFKIINHD